MTTALSTTPANDYYPNTNVTDYGQYHWPYWQQPTYIQPTVYTWPVAQQQRCAWCQGMHTGSCERIKSVAYREDGTVEKVEFFSK